MPISDYIIYSDISADIPAAYAVEKDIRFIPMSYTLGSEDRVCSSIEPDEILKKFYDGQRNGDLTHTTQISPFMYVEIFEPLLKEGKSVLYISLSSGLSNTYNSSLIAADELNEKYPEARLVCVDSLAATGGMGALLEMAVKNREGGMSIEENAKYLEENRLRIYHWFMVEDLMYLKRGGRIPATTAIVGSALNIKPLLKVERDGTLSTFAKKRGAKAAMNELLELYKTHSVGGDKGRPCQGGVSQGGSACRQSEGGYLNRNAFPHHRRARRSRNVCYCAYCRRGCGKTLILICNNIIRCG